MQQIYKSLPVEGKTMIVHINNRREVQIVNGYFVPNIELDTTPRIASDDAIQKAKTDLAAAQPITRPPKSELIVYHYENKSYLAWKILLISKEPLGEFIYYVDAHTGSVIFRYNNLQTIRDRRTHDANNGAALPGTLQRSEGDPATGDNVLDAAHDNAGIVYDLYNTNYNRDSYDDAGAILTSTVHFGNNYNNAFWSPSDRQMVYGDGDGVTFSPLSQALDVVAHELTHAVTESTSNLVYHDESGALNESISDIFGVLADPGDWMLGEDIFTPGTPNDALRYMDDPPRGGDPDHMNDYVTPDPNGSTMDRACYNSNDRYNGCVHFNSGIPNKAAFLMAAGGTHHGINVVGMGLADVGLIFYEAQVHWLTPNAGFMDARDATLDAVQAVFPGNQARFEIVQNAWAAVGVGNPAGGAWTFQLQPDPVNITRTGETETVTASLTDSSNPVPGVVVSFSIANASIATISSVSGTTGSDGRVTLDVTGQARGDTTITGSYTQGSNSGSETITVKVPVTSIVGFLILNLLLGIVFFRYLKKLLFDSKRA
jgi:thermolysin